MKNLNPFASINKDIEKLKAEVFGEEKKKQISQYDIYHFFSLPLFYNPTLKERVGLLEKQTKNLETKFNALLKHLDIEYVKITEENGEKVEIEKYRKIKKVKKVCVIDEDDN